MTLPELLSSAVVPLADASAPAGGPPDFMRSLLGTLPIVLIVMAAYVLLLRPEREKHRRLQTLLAGLKKNDRVLTSAGIYGTVVNVDRQADRVQLRIDDDARLTVTLSSVARVLGDKPDAEAGAD